MGEKTILENYGIIILILVTFLWALKKLLTHLLCTNEKHVQVIADNAKTQAQVADKLENVGDKLDKVGDKLDKNTDVVVEIGRYIKKRNGGEKCKNT